MRTLPTRFPFQLSSTPSTASTHPLVRTAALAAVLTLTTVLALTATGSTPASAAPAAIIVDDCTRMGVPAPAIGLSAMNVKGRWNYTAVGPDGPLSIGLQCGGQIRGSLKLGTAAPVAVYGRVVGTAYPATIEFTSYHPTFERFHKGTIERAFVGPIVIRQMRGAYGERHNNGTTICCYDWRATRSD